MARTYCKILAIATLLMGVLGFVSPHFLGFHLTPVHNLVHLATGGLAAWVGFAGSFNACRTVSRGVGAAYGLLALTGFVAPGLLGSLLGHPGLSARELMPDNLLHSVIMLSALGAGFASGGDALPAAPERA